MADEREEWLAHRFGVLEDVDVPALWEQIVGRADTDPVVDVLAPRRRRWVPLVAAAALLAIVVAGLLVFLRDDPQPADTPNPPPVGDNTVQIVEGDGDAATVTPTATAGIVTLDITNPTDDFRAVAVYRIKPELTLDEIDDAIDEWNGTGAGEVIVEEEVFTATHGPDDHFATSIHLDADRYVVLVIPLDSTLEPVPGALGVNRLLTIAPGDAGTLPTATLELDRITPTNLIGDYLAEPGPATIRIANTATEAFVAGVVELRPDATQGEWLSFANSQPEEVFDWGLAPISSVRLFGLGTADRTISVDLEGGDLWIAAPVSFADSGPTGLWVTVE